VDLRVAAAPGGILAVERQLKSHQSKLAQLYPGGAPQVAGLGGDAALFGLFKKKPPPKAYQPKEYKAPMAGRKKTDASLLELDPIVQTDVATFERYLAEGRGLRKGLTVKPEKGAFFRGISKKELARLLQQKGLVPYIYQADYKPKRGEPITLSQAIKADGEEASIMNHHAEGFTHRFTGVTSDLKIAQVNRGDGAVIRVKTKKAYSNTEMSRFSEKFQQQAPEREYLIPGVVKMDSIEIMHPGTGRFHSLTSAEGAALAQSLSAN